MSLELMRREGEELIIGENIKILVKEIRNKMVFLSVDAPKNFKINRTEIILQSKLKKNIEL